MRKYLKHERANGGGGGREEGGECVVILVIHRYRVTVRREEGYIHVSCRYKRFHSEWQRGVTERSEGMRV